MRLRLRRNRAAMVSLWVLGLYILAGLFGPMLSPHNYATVYPEFVKVPPSLQAYPKRRQRSCRPPKSALARARADVEDIRIDGETGPHWRSPRAAPIDPRVTRYLDRSDLFSELPASSRSRRTAPAP